MGDSVKTNLSVGTLSYVSRDYRKRIPYWGGHVLRAGVATDPIKILTIVLEGQITTYLPAFGSAWKGAMCSKDECTWDYEYVEQAKAPAGSLTKARLV